MRPDDETLLDIANAAADAESFVAGITEEAFRENRLLQAAVERKLIIIGEAVKRLSPEFRAAHGELPWRLMAGMRDVLTHQYDEVRIEDVWHAVAVEVPALRGWLSTQLPSKLG